MPSTICSVYLPWGAKLPNKFVKFRAKFSSGDFNFLKSQTFLKSKERKCILPWLNYFCFLYISLITKIYRLVILSMYKHICTFWQLHLLLSLVDSADFWMLLWVTMCITTYSNYSFLHRFYIYFKNIYDAMFHHNIFLPSPRPNNFIVLQFVFQIITVWNICCFTFYRMNI